ncbi:hypothetical protein SISNIDRAFT_108520 [Sistotremastrum niveocremeum HHB9708]|uniref:Uncharacterized protein n=1 Tax=Sistotremastrum niveocremeum HHB9708 TaxID=1314777 RepID=A0A164TZE0_9AGAM|nr:hypothetical protein SISNIDRAFT_108520 [Sistotremastrum niveocremeum HHB9708]
MPPIFSRNRWFGTILLISISFVSGSPATTTLTKAPNPTACPQYCIANEAFATPVCGCGVTTTSPKPTSTTPCAEDLCIWGRTPSCVCDPTPTACPYYCVAEPNGTSVCGCTTVRQQSTCDVC